MVNYSVILSKKSYKNLENYFYRVKNDISIAGNYLKQRLYGEFLFDISINQFIKHLLNTKKPTIFAESEIYGDGSDWNLEELSLLGDILIGADVEIFDNGVHYTPKVYKNSIKGGLVFIPGALLRNDIGITEAVDLKNIKNSSNRGIDIDKLYKLYENRLLPALHFCNNSVKKGEKVVITIPGIGCGQFAGEYRGKMGVIFEDILYKIIKNNHQYLNNIELIHYDPYSESTISEKKVGNIVFKVNPYLKSDHKIAQLSKIEQLIGDKKGDIEYKLYSFAAWDHVSWPGNDYYRGSRSTDDGVKGAATDIIYKITNKKGRYCGKTFKYLPPKGYKTWQELVKGLNIELKIDNLKIF